MIVAITISSVLEQGLRLVWLATLRRVIAGYKNEGSLVLVLSLWYLPPRSKDEHRLSVP